MVTNKHPNIPQSSDSEVEASKVNQSNANTDGNPCECPESKQKFPNSSNLWQFLAQLVTVIGTIIKILEFLGIEF